MALFDLITRWQADRKVRKLLRDDAPTRFRFTGSARFPLVIRDDV